MSDTTHEEEYDTYIEVALNPYGAWKAIQTLTAERDDLSDRIEELEAKLAMEVKLVEEAHSEGFAKGHNGGWIGGDYSKLPHSIISVEEIRSFSMQAKWHKNSTTNGWPVRMEFIGGGARALTPKQHATKGETAHQGKVKK